MWAKGVRGGRNGGWAHSISLETMAQSDECIVPSGSHAKARSIVSGVAVMRPNWLGRLQGVAWDGVGRPHSVPIEVPPL